MNLSMLALLLAALGSEPEEAHYVDASLDLDGDDELELVVAIGLENGERELRVHPLGKSGLQREAQSTIRVLPDVVAWGLADVRAEPGRELLFLTRSGAWSYSPTLAGYRDNVARLAEELLIYDMPDPRTLPHWAYVFADGGGDRILLPGRDRMSIWAPRRGGGAGETPYAVRSTLPTSEVDSSTEKLGPEGRSRSGGPRVASHEASPFLREGSSEGSTVLEDAYAYDAPAMLDVNGDSRVDLAILGEEHVTLYLASADGLPSEPTRVELLPDLLSAGDEEREVDLRLVDVDGDGLLDAVAQVADEADGFENRLHRILVYRGRAERLLGDEPDQVLRFEAGDLDFRIADVDGDGRVDLVVEKLELPSLVGAVTGIEFTFSLLVFRGEEQGFARRPTFTREETFDEETAVELAANRRWTHDCDGDGTADLVDVDLQGNITIRCLRVETSRLRGARWTLDPTPWKRFDVEGSIRSLAVDDFNGDGLGDVVSASEERLIVLLSVAPGGRR